MLKLPMRVVNEMYYADISRYAKNMKAPLESVRNAGWLDSEHDFEKGDPPQEFLAKLGSVISSFGALNVHVNRIRGMHPCSLCKQRGPFKIGQNGIAIGSSMLWIPEIEQGRYWAAPSLIYHYVEEHAYLPPEGFIRAVMVLSLDATYNGQDAYLDMVEGHF